MTSKRRSLPPFIKVDAARRHIVDGTPQAKLATEYQTSKSIMNRAISDVIENGWLLVSARANYPLAAKPNHRLSQELTNRYDSVERIHVLDLAEVHDDTPVWSDHVHHELGHYLGANHLRMAITQGDRIGVSSGRGVYHTIRGLNVEPIRVEDVTLMSLTGSFGNRAHSVHDPTIMDGDTNVGLFGQAFAKMVRIQTTGREIVVTENERRPAWFSAPPNRALIGIGVIEETSRIVSREREPGLHPLKKDLEELKSLTRESSTDNYIPCADMCNFLIHVPRPRGEVGPSDAALRKLIDKINARLCVVPFDVIKTVQSCWLAVGTAKKAHALHHCLTSGLRVSGLCIDGTIAEELRRLSA